MRHIPEAFPSLFTGWPDAEHEARHHWVFTNFYECPACGHSWNKGPSEGAGKDAFCPECGDLVDPVYNVIEREEHEDLYDLGFHHDRCDLCHALPGTRYAVTAYPVKRTFDGDYVALAVCEDCYHYVANGD